MDGSGKQAADAAATQASCEEPPRFDLDRWRRRQGRYFDELGEARCTWRVTDFPARSLLRGDFVRGPAAPVFGPGVKDVRVTTKRWFGWLSHSFLWNPDGEDRRIAGLREAVDLLSKTAREEEEPGAEAEGGTAEAGAETEAMP